MLEPIIYFIFLLLWDIGHSWPRNSDADIHQSKIIGFGGDYI